MASFLWIGFNGFKDSESLQGDSIFFKVVGGPGSPLIDLEKTKG